MGGMERIPRWVAKAAVVALGAQLLTWQVQRRLILRYQRKAMQFTMLGWVVVRGPTRARKKRALAKYWPRIEAAIRRVSAGYRQEDATTHPQGYDKEMTCTDSRVDRDTVKVWELCEPQAVTLMYMDPDLSGKVHFGPRTHWQLRYAMGGLLWLLFPKLGLPKESVRLRGGEMSWAMSMWPVEGSQTGDPFPMQAHIDGGRNGIFEKAGLPSASGGMLDMLANQVAFAAYYMNPEDLEPKHGLTGLYAWSHRVVLRLLRTAVKPISYSDFKGALRRWCDLEETESTLEQPQHLSATNLVLVHGALVHGSMKAQELPGDGAYPRIMCNPKLVLAEEHTVEDLDRALPSDSPARLLYDGGLELESEDRATGRVIQLVEMLRRQLTVDTVASAAAF